MRCGISPDYVLDQMTFYEMSTLLENLWMKEKESWEQSRMIINWCQQSAKPVNMFEKMKFPWEKNLGKEEDTPEERENVWREMKEMEKRMNKK